MATVVPTNTPFACPCISTCAAEPILAQSSTLELVQALRALWDGLPTPEQLLQQPLGLIPS
jgi:hypothetical protein